MQSVTIGMRPILRHGTSCAPITGRKAFGNVGESDGLQWPAFDGGNAAIERLCELLARVVGQRRRFSRVSNGIDARAKRFLRSIRKFQPVSGKIRKCIKR